MTTVPVPICYSCAHLNDDVLDGEPLLCTAYPDGIPDEIVESEVDHRLPYPGDHGIQFEQRPDRPEPDDLVFEGEP
jgi:hypothetical protein